MRRLRLSTIAEPGRPRGSRARMNLALAGIPGTITLKLDGHFNASNTSFLYPIWQPSPPSLVSNELRPAPIRELLTQVSPCLFRTASCTTATRASGSAIIHRRHPPPSAKSATNQLCASAPLRETPSRHPSPCPPHLRGEIQSGRKQVLKSVTASDSVRMDIFGRGLRAECREPGRVVNRDW
jgi:hypothetical protein